MKHGPCHNEEEAGGNGNTIDYLISVCDGNVIQRIDHRNFKYFVVM